MQLVDDIILLGGQAGAGSSALQNLDRLESSRGNFWPLPIPDYTKIFAYILKIMVSLQALFHHVLRRIFLFVGYYKKMLLITTKRKGNLVLLRKLLHCVRLLRGS